MKNSIRALFGMTTEQAYMLKDTLYDAFWCNIIPYNMQMRNLMRYSKAGRIFYLHHWEITDEVFMTKYTIEDCDDMAALYGTYCAMHTGEHTDAICMTINTIYIQHALKHAKEQTL